MNNHYHYKRFSVKRNLNREIKGYIFCSKYMAERMPKLINISDNDNLYVKYENIINTRQKLMSDVLMCADDFYLKDFFSKISLNVNSFAKIRKSEGGTELFFIKRKNRITCSTLQNDYSLFAKKRNSKINSISVDLDQGMLKHLIEILDQVAHGLCYPSQGDFHERNIVLPGFIVDFEAGGWNLLSTDIATFIWHTFFVGNYFGKKYAKWSNEETLNSIIRDTAKYSVSSGGNVSIPINKQRIEIYDQFDMYFLKNIEPYLDMKLINNSIAYRLLTTFDISKMSTEDRKMTYILANYFINDYNVDTREKIKNLLVTSGL